MFFQMARWKVVILRQVFQVCYLFWRNKRGAPKTVLALEVVVPSKLMTFLEFLVYLEFRLVLTVRRVLFLLGSLSEPRRRRHRERHQTKGLMSRTMAVHVPFESLYISLPSSAKQLREMIKFYVFWRTRTTMANFWYLLLEMIAVGACLAWANF